MGAALFGYLIRLALIFLAVWLVKDAAWVELVPLGITIIVTHLGLLFWEMKYVSAVPRLPGAQAHRRLQGVDLQVIFGLEFPPIENLVEWPTPSAPRTPGTGSTRSP